VLEYADCGDIASLLEKPVDGEKMSFTEQQSLNWLTHLLLALDRLHSEEIIHLDIKPANIFLQAKEINGFVKLGDFGNSKDLGLMMNFTIDVGTTAYNSPERMDGKLSDRADVWSLGCVFIYLLSSGGHPFADENTTPTAMLKNILFIPLSLFITHASVYLPLQESY
jgi:serine/threonine protein kinase